jgi:hypothetical protein
MKLNTTTKLASLAAVAMFAPGCKSLFVEHPTNVPIVTPARTNVTVTPIVIPGAGTNPPVTTIVTNVFVVPAATNYVTVTNYAPAPAALAALDTARDINAAVNPTPTAPVVNWALTGLSGALGLVAAWKSRRANDAATNAALLDESLRTVVTAIETAPPAVSDPIKEHVRGMSKVIGSSAHLAGFVKTTTDALKGVQLGTAPASNG